MSAGLSDRIPNEGPAAEVSCRVGYAELHIAFALLHLALLGYVLRSGQRAPWFLRGLLGGSGVFAVAIHVISGGTCASRTTSAMVHAHFATFPILRISTANIAANAIVCAAVSAHLIVHTSKGAVRVVKLGILTVLALASILLQGWWWCHDLTTVGTARVMSVLEMIGGGAGLLSILAQMFICSATKSRAMLAVAVSLLGIFAAIAALNVSFPVDLEGHLADYPEAGYCDKNLHWAVSLRSFLLNGCILGTRAAASHSMMKSRSDAPRPMVTFAADLPPAQPVTSEGLWLAAAVVIVAIYVQSLGLLFPHTAPFISLVINHMTSVRKQHARDLLGIDPEASPEAAGVWLIPCTGLGGCAVLLSLMVVLAKNVKQNSEWRLAPTRTVTALGASVKKRGPRKSPRMRGMLPLNFGNRPIPTPDLAETDCIAGQMGSEFREHEVQCTKVAASGMHSNTGSITAIAMIHDSLFSSLQPTVDESPCMGLDDSLAACLRELESPKVAIRNIEKQTLCAEMGVSCWCGSEISEQARTNPHCIHPIFF